MRTTLTSAPFNASYQEAQANDAFRRAHQLSNNETYRRYMRDHADSIRRQHADAAFGRSSAVQSGTSSVTWGTSPPVLFGDVLTEREKADLPATQTLDRTQVAALLSQHRSLNGGKYQ